MRAPTTRPRIPATERVLVLTILLHGDAQRVGEFCVLEEFGKLSRLEPEFSSPTSAERERQDRSPLGDPNLSRQPIQIEALSDGSVRLIPATGGTEISVNGIPLNDSKVFPGSLVACGLCIELASRIALLLHRRLLPVPELDDCDLVGNSEQMDKLRQQILRVADLDVPVLLRGPTGAGKELVAQALHTRGLRRDHTLVAVNPATLPSSMAASELFGHSKGAFTGADTQHTGLFARANGGTLFLDEVAETSLELQAMLLRVLETKKVQPLGGAKEQDVDVRLIAATDADLETLVAANTFREPLLHRLAGFQIAIPPLRERPDDVMRLLVHFVRDELAKAHEPNRWQGSDAGAPLWFPARLASRLTQYSWPGNVRELRNVARHIVIANRGNEQIEDDDFLLALAPSESSDAPIAERAANAGKPSEINQATLIAVLRKHDWKTAASARALGISRTSLYALMERTPGIRKAKDLSAKEIQSASYECNGNGTAMASRLEVSERGLKLRIKELELSFG